MKILFVYPDFQELHKMKDIGQLFVNLNQHGHYSQILTYQVKGNVNLNNLNSVELIRTKYFLKTEQWIFSPFNIGGIALI